MSNSGAEVGRRVSAWRVANREWLQHGLAALRHRVALYTLGLRTGRAGEPLAAHRQYLVSDEELDRLLAGTAAPDLSGDPRAAELRRAEREEEGAMADKEAALTAAGTPPALAVLSARFGLGDFERWALLAACAPEFDPAIARLYAYANDDARCPWPTPQLLADLRGDRSSRDAFLPVSPLRRWGLLRHGVTRPQDGPAVLAPLTADQRVVSYLDGVNLPDEAVSHLLSPVVEPLAAEPHRELAARLAAWFAEGGEWDAPVQLSGRPGCGRRAVAALTSRLLGAQLHSVDLTRLLAGEDARPLLRLLAREARLLPSALFLDAGETGVSADGRAQLERLVASLAALPGPIFVGVREPLRLDQRVGRASGPVVTVPRLDVSARASLLATALGLESGDGGRDGALSAAVLAVSAQYELGPEAAVRAAVAARQEARLADGAAATVDGPAVWRACRRIVGVELDDLAQRVVPAASWNDIVLPEDVTGQLRELAAQVGQRAKVYGEWGFGPRLNRGRGIAALFAGSSGTGKTMAAEVLACHLDLDLYRIDLAGVVSKYIGETERNLRRVFDAAEAGGAILFFDEADALFGRRTDVKDSHDRYANIEIDYLLQRMEEYRGLAILASNRKTALDRAFLRRLRFVVEFPFPDAAARRRIWRLAFPSETPLVALDYDALGRLELAGGNIRNVSLNAAFLAADAGEGVGMAHLAAAARSEYAKCEKSMSQSEIAALVAAEKAAA